MLNFILPFIVLIVVVVFIHEYGHYYFAKKYGVGVTDFSIGFGKEIFSNKALLKRYGDILSFFLLQLTAPSSDIFYNQFSNISQKLSLPTEVRCSSLKKLKSSKFNSAHDEVIIIDD